MMNYVCMSIPVDDCLNTETSRKQLIEQINFNSSTDLEFFINASQHQSLYDALHTAYEKNSPFIFDTFPYFLEELAKCKSKNIASMRKDNKLFLLQDVFLAKSTKRDVIGKNFEDGLNWDNHNHDDAYQITKTLHKKINDSYGIATLYGQMHKKAAEIKQASKVKKDVEVDEISQDPEIDFRFVETDKNRLEKLAAFYDKNKHLVPKNIKLNFYHYDEQHTLQAMQDLPCIKGTGIIDSNYLSTLKSINHELNINKNAFFYQQNQCYAQFYAAWLADNPEIQAKINELLPQDQDDINQLIVALNNKDSLNHFTVLQNLNCLIHCAQLKKAWTDILADELFKQDIDALKIAELQTCDLDQAAWEMLVKLISLLRGILKICREKDELTIYIDPLKAAIENITSQSKKINDSEMINLYEMAQAHTTLRTIPERLKNLENELPNSSEVSTLKNEIHADLSHLATLQTNEPAKQWQERIKDLDAAVTATEGFFHSIKKYVDKPPLNKDINSYHHEMQQLLSKQALPILTKIYNLGCFLFSIFSGGANAAFFGGVAGGIAGLLLGGLVPIIGNAVGASVGAGVGGGLAFLVGCTSATIQDYEKIMFWGSTPHQVGTEKIAAAMDKFACAYKK